MKGLLAVVLVAILALLFLAVVVVRARRKLAAAVDVSLRADISEFTRDLERAEKMVDELGA